jgi:hypothetical protein
MRLRACHVGIVVTAALLAPHGETVYKRLAGTGFGYNNNFAPVTIGPDQTAYVGVLGGITQFRDTGP